MKLFSGNKRKVIVQRAEVLEFKRRFPCSGRRHPAPLECGLTAESNQHGRLKMETNHAYDNAQGWAGTIAELVAALECDYDRLEELREERASFIDDADDKGIGATVFDATDEGKELADLTATATADGELMADADAVRERIQDGPLSVEIRSGWYSTGETPEPEEFAILLSTGGPALRIRGELQNGEPRRAWLEYQDWGTPWTEYHPGPGEGCGQQTLLTYCQQFYFGD